MDYRRDSGGNVVHVIPTNIPPPETWVPNPNDSAMWATEEDYNRVWLNPVIETSTDTLSNSSYDQRRSGSEQPPNKKSRNSQADSSATNSRIKAIGKMFFKTKLCCKFRSGTCPYVTNCNFAHSVEELRRPPPNWQEIVAASGGGDQVEEFQIPSMVSTEAEIGRSYKGRHCKKFYTEEGCPYGDSCSFLHDEASKNRESVAISLGPGGYGGGSGGGGGSSAAAAAAGTGAGSSNSSGVIVLGGGAGGTGVGQNMKPSNWKTRICNKWELTGYCPFGSKCHFAHGSAELHRYGGGLVDIEAKDGSGTPFDPKQGGVTPKASVDTLVGSTNMVPHSDVYHVGGVQSQRPSSLMIQKPGLKPHQKWKGPDKISRIYGDWIDDFE